jgi:outer membrane protein assembly complex protein YaeT
LPQDPTPGNQFWGQPILDIRLSCDAPLTLKNFPGAISQTTGQPLDPSKLAQSLKQLYATGRFSDLRADAEPGQGGVHLIFVGRAQYFIGVVQVEGTPSPLEPTVLVTSSRLRLGQPISDESLAAAERHIPEVLASNGYYQTAVRYRIIPNPNTQEAAVVFSVFPGKPARLSAVEFQDRSAFPSLKLEKVAGWKPGMYLTSARVERGLSKLHQFFVARNRLQATVSVQKRVYDVRLNTEKLVVRVDTGPLVRVRIMGAKISNSKLRALLPFYRDGVVDEPALANSEAILEHYLQEKGYFAAKVKAERTDHAESATLDLIFKVNRGTAGLFEGYGLEGNRVIPSTELMAAILPSEEGIFRPLPLYSQDILESKINALIAIYHSRGFLDVRITSRVDDRYKDRPRHRFVTLQVEEGPQTTVGQLAVNGIPLDMQKALWPSLISKQSRPYSTDRAAIDRDTISNYLANLGYPQASVSWHASSPSQQHQVDLEFRIDLGPQEKIEKIVILGNEHTRIGVIQRELIIHDGQPLSQSKVLESQRRLYELGMFNQVQIAPQDRSNPDQEKTVLVAVEESRRWSLGYGGGLEVQRLGSNQPQGEFKASPRLSLDLSRLDVGGRGQTFTLWGRLSDIETGGGTSFVIPYLAGRRDLSFHINGLVDRSSDVLTFTDDRKEASLTIEKRFNPSTAISTRYTFSRVTALDISNRVSPDEIALLSKPARVGGFGASYARDHRDDPSDATRGSYTLADSFLAYNGFGSESDFIRFTSEYATYYRLGTHLIFARNTRFGFESPYGRAGLAFIPLPERFFMGGSESHRGFSINQAGPRDPETGYPIGGDGLFFNSLELRVPLASRRIGFVFFDDSGNVFTTIRRMRLLKFNQSGPADFDYDSNAVGLGVRYKTPVGPIRFDVGYNMNPPRYQVTTTTGVEEQRLSQFQFFLSIGQSF